MFPKFKYLFVDDRWIEKTHSVHREPGRVRKHPDNPLLSPAHPWEEGLKCYGTAIYEQDKFRLWYQALAFGQRLHPSYTTAVGYAESSDGLAWDRPPVGLDHPLFGKTHWVVLSNGRSHLCSPSVVKDFRSRIKSDRRYKMMFYDAMDVETLRSRGSPFPPDPAVSGWGPVAGEGIFVAFSGDGLHWTKHPFPVIGGPNDVSSVSQLSDGTFLATYKTSTHRERHFRVIGSSRSRDFLKWTPTRVILEPDWRDPVGTEFYGMSGFEYFGNFLGLICVYQNSPDNKTLDIQLAGTADGENWERCLERRPLIEVGGRGRWDAGGIYVASTPLVSPPQAPEEIWLYYSGISARHDDMRFKEWEIGLAILRLDGFAVMRSGYFKGWLLTKTLTAGSERLCVNANCKHGWLNLTVFDPRDSSILALSESIQGTDGTALEPPMQILKPFLGREVVLLFQMQKCDLYSFWFAPDD